jgi:hypothetical protein
MNDDPRPVTEKRSPRVSEFYVKWASESIDDILDSPLRFRGLPSDDNTISPECPSGERDMSCHTVIAARAVTEAKNAHLRRALHTISSIAGVQKQRDTTPSPN